VRALRRFRQHGSQVAGLPHRVGESGYFEHPRVRDGFIDIFESLGFGEIGAAEAGRRMHTDVNRILERVIRPVGEHNGG